MNKKARRYTGTRKDGKCLVNTDLGELDPRLDLANKSPTGFEWGYVGSGPGQLALAILACHLEDDSRAIRLMQRFTSRVVGQFAIQGFELNAEDIDRWLVQLEQET